MPKATPLTLGFLQFMEAAPDAMVCIDATGAVVLVNAQAEKLFGVQRNNILGGSIEQLIPSRFHKKHMGLRDGYIADPHVRPMGAGRELLALRSDGTEFPVEISLSPITTPEGTITAASIRDTSDRVRAEKKFRSLLDSAPDAMVIVDEQGDIVLVNAQAQIVFGYTREELLGNKIEMLIPQRFHPGHPGHRDGFMAAPQTRSMGSGIELFATRKDGTEFPVEISLSPIETDEGRLVAAAVRDVTARKISEASSRDAEAKDQQLHQLKEIDEFRTRFINDAAHELFTPLTPILATLAVLRRHDNTPDQVSKSLDILDRSFTRLSGLVTDLLVAARFQSGRINIEKTEVDLAKIVKDVAAEFAAATAEKDATISIDCPSSLPVAADATRLNQILYNLLSNALKFGDASIQVTARKEAEEVIVQVRDDGLGMTQDQLGRLFEPFVRLHEERIAGTGLGLYISQGFATAHGGSLSAESDGPGTGAMFTLRLPVESS